MREENNLRTLGLAITLLNRSVYISSKEISSRESSVVFELQPLVSGGLYIEGSRSHILYSWADCGDVVDVEYRDLVYLVRTREDVNIYSPRIIIEDEDFIEQNKSVKDFYDSMYTTGDLNDILLLPISDMKSAIEQLPRGAKESIKGIASTMINSHILDSVQKIKVLDEIFGTNMLLTLVQE